MIIGYQVTNCEGDCWNDRPSFEVLPEELAIQELKNARDESDDTFQMVAVLEGDIENYEMVESWDLIQFPE